MYVLIHLKYLYSGATLSTQCGHGRRVIGRRRGYLQVVGIEGRLNYQYIRRKFK